MLALTGDQLNQLATFYGQVGQTLSPAWVWASSFLVLIIIVLFLVGFARFMGYGPFVALIAALYIAYAMYFAFPFLNYLPSAPALTALAAQVALFLAFFLISYLLLRRVAASDFVHMGTLGLVVVSLATAGFIMALAYQSFPVQTVYHFTPQLDQLFATKEWFFGWFIAPFITLYVFANKR